MTNNNQPLKGLQGETVEQAADRILKTYHPINHDHELKTDLWPESTVLMAMVEIAHWQSQQPAEKESATVDEMAIAFFKNDYIARCWPKYAVVHIFKAAYNMRDKEQAGAVEILQERIKELQVQYEKDTKAGHDIYSRAGAIVAELTTLLAQLTK